MTTRPLPSEQPIRAQASPELIASLRTRKPFPASFGDAPTAPPTATAPGAVQAFQPVAERFAVRAHSVFATANPTIWPGRVSDEQRSKLWKSAVTIEKKTRGKGRADGEIKRSGLTVYRTLLWYQSLSKDGRCDPSLATLAEKCMLCVRTVSKAIDRLARCGLVSVTRRWVRVPINGIMVARQITSAYKFPVTQELRLFIPPPLPPITRSVTAATRRSLRKGVAFFKGFFHKPGDRPPEPYAPPNFYDAAFDGTASTGLKT